MAALRKPPSARIQQAVSIVAEQLGCGEAEAHAVLRERAEALQYRLHNYALLVIEGMVRFDE
jgi:AmiR/NasT family two-component response regulator